MFDLEVLANATVQVEARGDLGSGFHFLREDIVITNHHVVARGLVAGGRITVRSEDGPSVPAAMVASSPTDERDFAILRLDSALPGSRHPLVPGSPPKRGDEVAFAGFPHGIGNLLAHRAFVSGPAGDHGFHLDGSVNGGNSGGPIINAAGEAVGIVTQRRYIGAQPMDQLAVRATALAGQAKGTSGSAFISGIDFGAVMGMIGDAFALLALVSAANANSGIGIGFDIRFVADQCKAQGL